jgi:hypothetical protein
MNMKTLPRDLSRKRWIARPLFLSDWRRYGRGDLGFGEEARQRRAAAERWWRVAARVPPPHRAVVVVTKVELGFGVLGDLWTAAIEEVVGRRWEAGRAGGGRAGEEQAEEEGEAGDRRRQDERG